MIQESINDRELPVMADLPSEIMRSRWLGSLEGSIPACDLEDTRAVLLDP